MEAIKFGWSEKELIPKGVKVSLAGQFYERISDEVESTLTVTALAVESGDDCAVFCSCDLVSVSQTLVKAVRKCLETRSDIPSQKVIVSAIHTHTAPAYANRSDTSSGSFRKMTTEEAMRLIDPKAEYHPLVSTAEKLFDGEKALLYMAERIAEAAAEAWDARAEGSFAPGFGRAAVGMCRRVSYDDGTSKMWGDTDTANFTHLEGGNDSGIEILFLYGENKKLTGIVANVACPAQVLEHRNFISSDYWGKVKEILRKEWGEDLFVLGLCSAAGDQCPRDMIRWVEPETPINDPNIFRESPKERGADPSMFDLKGCRLAARRIATEILYAKEESPEAISCAKFSHRVENICLPLRRVTQREYEEALDSIRKFIDRNGSSVDYKDSAYLHVYTGTINRYLWQQKCDTVNVESHFIRLGDIAFATNPFELFLDYGNRIRARSRASQTFLIQLCQGAFGYLPTKKAQEGGHYSAYVSSGLVGYEGGDLLVRKSVETIRDLFEEK